MRFLNRIAFEKVSATDWMLTRPLRYQDSGGQIVEIPQGFVTDGFSAPSIAWRVIPPAGRYDESAVLHDYFYRCRHYGQDADARRRSDNEFRLAMLWQGMTAFRARLIWLGVRMGGRYAWAAVKHTDQFAQ